MITQNNEIKFKKIAEIPNSEEGAKEYLRLMAGIVLANWDSDKRLREFAEFWNPDYFFEIWFPKRFKYLIQPENQEYIIKPQTWLDLYESTGWFQGDCKIAAIFLASMLKQFKAYSKLDGSIRIMQVINYNKPEKHAVAGFVYENVLTIYDPTLEEGVEIDPERIKLFVEV